MKKFLTLFVLVCPLLALAQQTRQITGQVLDRADGAPLVGATVFIAPEETQAKDYNPQEIEERRVGKEWRSRWSPYH